MSKISTCFWFNGQAEEAAKFYASLFKNSKIGKTSYYTEAVAEVSGQKKGSVMTVDFEIEGFQFEALNGGPQFKMTPAISFFVNCETEKEVDTLWGKLTKGGQIMMELDKYEWSKKYGWVQDKYGVSWQLILSEKFDEKIFPSLLFVNKKVGKGEEAIKFYTSVFKNSKIKEIFRDEKSKTIMYSDFKIEGCLFSLMESSIKHEFDFSEGTSFIINCKNQDEVDYYWDRLIEGGGDHSQCGWLKDKYGVSWQVVPTILGELVTDKDSARVERVMKAMLKMKKLDIEALKKAYK